MSRSTKIKAPSSKEPAAPPEPEGNASPLLSRDAGLQLLVFSAGGVLMGLEIAGSRVLAPHFGNSVFVWGSLISVFLLALSVGYVFGGRLADRVPSHRAEFDLPIVSLLIFAIAVVARRLCAGPGRRRIRRANRPAGRVGDLVPAAEPGHGHRFCLLPSGWRPGRSVPSERSPGPYPRFPRAAASRGRC